MNQDERRAAALSRFGPRHFLVGSGLLIALVCLVLGVGTVLLVGDMCTDTEVAVARSLDGRYLARTIGQTCRATSSPTTLVEVRDLADPNPAAADAHRIVFSVRSAPEAVQVVWRGDVLLVGYRRDQRVFIQEDRWRSVSVQYDPR